MKIRQATHADIPEIVSFTTDTFEWGDYVPDMIAEWIDDPSGVVMVAEDNSEVIALGRVTLLSDTEAWAHAARVKPERRGEEIAGDLADVLLAWARDRGALVARLLIEDDNEASIRHITKKGFRRVATVVRASRTIGDTSPNPEGNGGQRTPASVSARRVRTADASLLAAGWSSSICGRPLRGLVGDGWRFRRLTDQDVISAARAGDLWEVGSSWAITRHVDTSFDVSIIDTVPADAISVMQALIDEATAQGAESFSMWLADLEWLTQAARSAGCDLFPSGIWIYSL
ncbi:MAG: GNAT family N-acetyltransferase [Actinomycetota bacterium]|nr:GNAT family N-acetyltransferase [Actinomycetota bacterium]MDK1026677.1 GNAT family N-acetyltransferase [Actinomycetota bacterium]MDK1037533.1 GNAT family N-acetyltransferase [Actinomycetota bacterium]MDK1102327.1 GNAT family N-acetyltransferase [Actinomycetota bacterium]